MNDIFTIEARHWYSWQMLPGYTDAPYFSPIYVHKAKPLKTGQRLLQLSFFNACYAEGVQGVQLDLRIMKRASSYLFAELVYPENSEPDRSAIVGNITFEWLRECMASCIQHHPSMDNEDIEHYLERITGFKSGRQ